MNQAKTCSTSDGNKDFFQFFANYKQCCYEYSFLIFLMQSVSFPRFINERFDGSQ